MVNDPTDRFSRALSDPAMRERLLESMRDDPEASSAIEHWTQDTASGTDFLKTGGGAPDAVWERIRERIITLGGPPPGTPVGRYLILHTIGVGGMGSVHAAYDPELDRKVAIKILHPVVAAGARDAQERLLREARALAQLSHPNVVAVHDVGTYEDQLFLAMEFVEGCDAAAWLKQTERSPLEIIDLFLEAGAGLAAAHSAGLVHRDFKPHNVLVGDDGRIRVADFGLARPPLDEESPATVNNRSESVDRLTRIGTVLGTPAYMAPEQLEGREFDERSDQFAFCVSLWEALFGERPFCGKTLGELAESFKRGDLREPETLDGVPAETLRVLKRGLSIDPDRRYPSMDALLEDLANVPGRRRKRILLGGLIVLVAVVAGLILTVVNHDPSRICDGSRGLLKDIWDPPTKAAIHQAFTATGQPFAADAWSTVENALDRYTDAWVEHRQQNCQATRLRGEQSVELMDLRMICFEDRRRELRVLSRLFEDADSQVVRNAVDAVAALTPLEYCDDAAALSARGPLPPDPGERTAIEKLQTAFARARTQFSVGKYRDATDDIESLIDQAEDTGYRPLIARIRTLNARILGQLGRFDSARAEYRVALALAIAARDDRLAGEISTRFFHLVGSRLGMYDEGHAWARLARAWFDRVGDAGEFGPLILSYEAMIYREEGKNEKAMLQAQEALTTASRVFGPMDPRLVRYLDTMAVQLRLSGQLDEALDLELEARDLLVRVRGPHHPDILTILINLGGMYDELGQRDQAETTLREALDLAVEIYGRNHMQTGLILTTLGNVVSRRGRFADALELYDEALAVFETTHGPDSFILVYPLGGKGEALIRMRRPAEAVVPLERALVILEKNPARNGLAGQCKLFLARALWEDRHDLPTVRRLLREARPDLVRAGPLAEHYLVELDAFERTLSTEQ